MARQKHRFERRWRDIGVVTALSTTLLLGLYPQSFAADSLKNAMLGGDEWTIICSSSGLYLLNLETGERRKGPANEDHNFACHSVSAVNSTEFPIRRDGDRAAACSCLVFGIENVGAGAARSVQSCSSIFVRGPPRTRLM